MMCWENDNRVASMYCLLVGQSCGLDWQRQSRFMYDWLHATWELRPLV
jgi:hypothetical protein